MKIRLLPITKARNDFFRIVTQSHLRKEVFLIEKSGIPLSYIIPAGVDGVEDLVGKLGKKKKNDDQRRRA